jgi:hypothetical protein
MRGIQGFNGINETQFLRVHLILQFPAYQVFGLWRRKAVKYQPCHVLKKVTLF